MQRIVVVALLVLAASQPAAAWAKTRTLKGTVAYRERTALPPGAAVVVKLVDVSRADAPSATLAETRIAPKGQVPIPYRLRYDDKAILPGRSYALRASITVGGQLWFVTTTRHPVLAGGKDKTDILVERVRAPAPMAAAGLRPVGRWLAEDIRGGGVIDSLQTVLEIAADGAVSGSGGCNRMSGTAVLADGKIIFGPLASTKRACPPAVMDQEGKFFAALKEVRAWRLDQARGKLSLLDAAGVSLVVLTRI